MTDLCELSNELAKAFLIGVLLSGSFKRTEQSLISGIAVLELDENFREEILLWVVKSNLTAQSVRDGEVTEREGIETYLPPLLSKVSELPAPLWRCFVLRLLLGWPLDRCTKLLETDAVVIDELLIAACEYLSESIVVEVRSFVAAN